jgi:hypothetical protein
MYKHVINATSNSDNECDDKENYIDDNSEENKMKWCNNGYGDDDKHR